MTYTCIFCQSKSKAQTVGFGCSLHNFPCSPNHFSTNHIGHYYNLLTLNNKVVRESVDFENYNITYYYEYKEIIICDQSPNKYIIPYTDTFNSANKIVSAEQAQNFLMMI